MNNRSQSADAAPLRRARWFWLIVGMVLLTAVGVVTFKIRRWQSDLATLDRLRFDVHLTVAVPAWLPESLESVAAKTGFFAQITGIRPRKMSRYGTPEEVEATLEILTRHQQTLEEVQLVLMPLDDRHLESLANARRIEFLDLSGTKITNRALKSLRKMRLLRRLSLQDTAIDNAGLRHLNGLLLREIHLDYNDVDDDGLDLLVDLPHIEVVSLSATQVTDEGVGRLSRRFPGVQVYDD